MAVGVGRGNEAEALKIGIVMFGSDDHGQTGRAEIIVEQLHEPRFFLDSALEYLIKREMTWIESAN